MAEQPLIRGAGRFFRRLGPRAQVALCQLPSTIVMVSLVVVAPAVWPGLLHNPMFVTGAALHIALFGCCLLIPWERFSPSASLAIPLLDLAALFLTRNGAYNQISGLSLLAIFPIIWLAASGMLARTSLIFIFVGQMLF